MNSYFALLSLHKNVMWSYDSQKWPNEILHSNNQFICCWSISVSALLFEGIVKPKTVVLLILMSFQTSMLLFVLWNTKGEILKNRSTALFQFKVTIPHNYSITVHQFGTVWGWVFIFRLTSNWSVNLLPVSSTVCPL